MDKGTRVHITGGRQGKGQSGTIFWKGPNKYGPGERFGVRGDDGATYWVVEDDVEKTDGGPPPVPDDLPTYAKGDRVTLSQNGEAITGAIFWIGDSKLGGQRLGLKREDDGETVWIDAQFVSPATGSAPPQAANRAPSGGGSWQTDSGDVDDEMPADYATPMDIDEMPPMAPMEDDAIDRYAAEVEEED